MESLITYIMSLRPLTGEEKTEITSHFQAGHFPEGDYLFRGGRVCTKLFFIVSGVVRLVAVNDKGVEVTHYFVGENQFCTNLASFTNETVAEDSIQCCSPAVILTIQKSQLLALYRKLPFMEDLIGQVNQQRLLEKIRLKNIYSGEDSAGRYRLFLSEQPEIAGRVPLSHVASYLNITPQSLSRIRRQMKSSI
ncbi:MAG TPA: Crp/Fnr family transcriptional regulator [Puia sp.]|nr:Crp/Fnr family transcriptional regulator [Puia sp.]